MSEDILNQIHKKRMLENQPSTSKKKPRLEPESGMTGIIDENGSGKIENHNVESYTNYTFNEDLRRKRPEKLTPNHVLLFTIVSPRYPITVHVLNTICSPIGPVQRIVIFKKNGVQAMVEFDSIDTANRAKENLNGAYIYSGCCSLKIEYAKPTKLNVHKNDFDSWDYTLTARPDAPSRLETPRRYGLLTPPNGTQPGGSCVMMVYGLDKDKVNADKLFNIFCLYGNVIKIKFLKTKEGCAMIQMGDTISVERCISNLNNSSVGHMQIQLGVSKQMFLSDVKQPYSLSDNTPSFKNFKGSNNNRFNNPTMASKNRIQAPSKVLHFFNTPPNITEETLKELFFDKCDLQPNVRLFPMKDDRRSSGLLEFDRVENGLLALMLCNHAPVKNPYGEFPYVMKLCFSSTRFPVSLNYQDSVKSEEPNQSE